MKVLLGGTFSVLHRAHREMIMKGARLGELFIGVTSDQFAETKKYAVPPYLERKKNVERYLKEKGLNYVVRELNDSFGSTLDPEFHAIVVSNETFDFVREINYIRKSRGISPLHVENVGTILGDDLLPIKSERIIQGEIDPDGKRIRKLRIALSTENHEKVLGSKSFFSKIFNDFDIETFGGKRDFPSQPMNDEIFEGARRRTEMVSGNYDYFVGIEAGIISYSGRSFDIHVAAVKDCFGKMTYGTSSGLFIGEHLMQDIKEGEELERVIDRMLKINNSGKEKGAIFYLSNGLKSRNELVQEALLSAFTERLGASIPRTIK